MKEVIIYILLFGGVFFFTVGTIGLLRLPDFYCRLHANTKSDTLGVGLVLFSLFLHEGLTSAGVKLLIMILFIWITNPTAGHIIAKASYDTGVPRYTAGSGKDREATP